MEHFSGGVLMEKVIFHVDANSAFLSWTAVYRCKVLEETTDLRDIPSAIADDKENRQGAEVPEFGSRAAGLCALCRSVETFYPNASTVFTRGRAVFH